MMLNQSTPSRRTGSTIAEEDHSGEALEKAPDWLEDTLNLEVSDLATSAPDGGSGRQRRCSPCDRVGQLP
jgi:hypothetical protein